MSFPFTVPLNQTEIMTPTSTQKVPLGTRGADANGRIFRYTKNGGTALERGHLISAEVHATQWGNATAGFWDTDHSASTPYAGTTAIAAGATFMNLSATCDSDLTVAADYFKEGWLWVSGTATNIGGQLMKIATHNVASSGSTGHQATGGKLYVEFEAGYVTVDAIDTAAEVSIVKNEFDDVVVAPTALLCRIVGATACDVDANYYFWAQTWGIIALKSEAEAIEGTGKMVTNSTQTAGTIQGASASTDSVYSGALGTGSIAPVGYVVQSTGTSAMQASCYIMVHLTLSP